MRRIATPAAAAALMSGCVVVGLLAAPAGAQDPAPEVLAPVTDQTAGQEQNPAEVAARIDKLAKSKPMGKVAGTVIMDVESGNVLYDDDGGVALTPASTNKITTAVAALRLAGANKQLSTRTTRSKGGSDVYIVGGGDPLLVSRQPKPEHPGVPNYPNATSMAALARDTAKSLKDQGSGAVDLKVDDSLFTGPNWGPEWPEYYRSSGIVAPVSALMVDDGRIGGQWGPKSPDPAMTAGQTFASLLRKAGVTVKSVKRAKSPSDAQDLAQVSSVPIYELVGQALTTSDNDTAESLFRLAAIGAGQPGSFDGGGKAVTKALEDIGISTVMASFRDGSGLSKEDRIPPRLLTEVLRRVVRGEDGLWPIGSGLAVAGVTGTLRYRFQEVTTKPAAGWVRAKTGTLNYVSSLAGFVQSRSGRILAFASIANEADSSSDAGRVIDQMIARVAECGCPGNDR